MFWSIYSVLSRIGVYKDTSWLCFHGFTLLQAELMSMKVYPIYVLKDSLLHEELTSVKENLDYV